MNKKLPQIVIYDEQGILEDSHDETSWSTYEPNKYQRTLSNRYTITKGGFETLVEKDFIILEIYSMKEILQMNPEASFDEDGDLWRTADFFQDAETNIIDRADFCHLGKIIKNTDLVSEFIPIWAIKRNLGR
jgi:hypothetical protein